MAERTVFLVYGYDSYEFPYDPIKAFASDADAKALLAAISDHQSGRPRYPSDDASDAEHETFDASFDAWRSKHPAGDAWSHDGFDVMQLQLEDPTHDRA